MNQPHYRFVFVAIIIVALILILNETVFRTSLPVVYAESSIPPDTQLVRHSPSLYKTVNDRGNGNPYWYLSSAHRNTLPAHYTIQLYPEEDPQSDRIANQLRYLPKNAFVGIPRKMYKTILVWRDSSTSAPVPEDVLTFAKCPVNKCVLTTDQKLASSAHMIFFNETFEMPPIRRHSDQIFTLLRRGDPTVSQDLADSHSGLINWTSSYRLDSDVVLPYSKWRYFQFDTKSFAYVGNMTAPKTKTVAFLDYGSDIDHNHHRRYIQELQRFIKVDVYTIDNRGPLRCLGQTVGHCLATLGRDYKFYLAFENSNCRDYITEKFFVNALGNNMVPIAMGARLDDYRRVAPENSFIHVDEFRTTREMAEYLHLLDNNDELYNNFFGWKGAGEFVDTEYWCRICAMLHDKRALAQPRWTRDFNAWWRTHGETCTSEPTWRTDTSLITVCSKNDHNRTSSSEVAEDLHEAYLCF